MLFIGAVWYFQHKAHQKKIAEFTAFAAQRGWRYISGTPRSSNGSSATRSARDTAATPSTCCAASTAAGRSWRSSTATRRPTVAVKDRRTETYRFTVVALALPAGKPTLQVSREGFGRKLLGFVGVRDLQLESEQFNEAFHIKTDNDRFAYDVLHPRMMEWMLADQRAQSTPFRFERGDLMTWDRGKIDLPKVEWMLEYLCDIVDQVPSFVWKS